MRRLAGSALILAGALALTSGVQAQPRDLRGGPGVTLEPGDPFPEISVFDAHGKAFSTKSLKGKYTVIVNGCLT